jgi:oligopeptide transport system substrate-binding protein
MHKPILLYALLIILIAAVICGCATAPTPEPNPPTAKPTQIPPSEIPPTSTPEPTATPIPTPTPLPGAVVLPVDTLAQNFPWLPLDNSARPGIYCFTFNVLKPPFNSILVRQAFTASIDREVLFEIIQKYATTNPRLATSFTPPETLGRDLYNEVGILFNPEHAKELLEQAGYTDMSKFPAVTLLINVSGGGTPYFHTRLATEMAQMWEQNLGITVNVELVTVWEEYLDRINSNPPEIFRLGWVADYNDPDNFLRELFETDSEYNYGNFSNADFDELVKRAAESTDPAERQVLYIQAERLLCEIETAVIPIYHATWNTP